MTPWWDGHAVRYTRPMLLCTVRGCHMALVRQKQLLCCTRGHSFDVARSGYINLLGPQERRSRKPGDTAAAAAGRRRLHDRGVTERLLRAIADIMAASPSDSVLDAGCGDGFYLGSLARQIGFDAHGIDISMPAIDAAARRYSECERIWAFVRWSGIS
jgi:23S rRNA (guanine745-N1)-methyltransferase